MDYGTPIGNGPWAIERSRDRWRHVTMKVKVAVMRAMY